MLRFLKKQAALVWAKLHVKAAQKYKDNAPKDQERLLKELISKAEKTLFGRSHQFEQIRSIKDFQKRVPLYDYEALRPYIEKVKRGQSHILWPGQPQYFAKTSGTTSGSKYIPISHEAMPYQLGAAQSAIFHYIAKKGNADFVNGKMIFLQGSPHLDEEYGILTGRLSGIVAHHIPSYLQKNRLPSLATNTIEDWEQKVDAIVEETETQDMTLISGIPPWLIMYFEKLTEKHGKKITHLFPNLQLLITGGVNYEPYREKMEELLGKPVDTIQTFPASEGFFAFQDDYTKPGLQLLTNHGIFYEFIPLESYGKPDAPRLSLAEVKLEKDYALILSTNSGLWAYSIGDVVRFISLSPYRIVVSGRTKHYTSAFGEHVIAYEVEESMKATAEKFNAQISEYHLAPQVSPSEGLPYHQWFVEFEREPSDLDAFSTELDKQLRSRNSYYDDLVKGHVLRPLVLTSLQRNAFIEMAKSQGKLGGQNKLPRLSNDRKIAEQLEPYTIP